MSWNKYYKAHKKTDTSRLLSYAGGFMGDDLNGEALDIASGTGHDIPFLLEKGFKVTAFDKESKSIEIIKSKFGENPKVSVIKSTIEEYKFEPNTYGFINAQFALFFISQEQIKETLGSIIGALRPNGIFCGQILGPEDEWASLKEINTLERKEVKKIFSGFEFIEFSEIQRKGKTAIGKEKFWHFYNIVARKSD